VQRRLRALHRILQPARTDICAPPSHSGPKTRAAAFPGTLLPGTASQVRPTDKRTGEVQAYAAFPWASDEVLCWERRREMLRAELVSCEADVICLQVGATSIPKMTPPTSVHPECGSRSGHLRRACRRQLLQQAVRDSIRIGLTRSMRIYRP